MMTDFDAVVLGGGAAGMMAALRAADLGARVALVDGSGGTKSNLWASSGLFAAAGTRFQAASRVTDGAAPWAADIRRKAGAVDPAVVDVVAGRSADVAHFFADRLGLEVEHMPELDIPGHSVARLHQAHGEGGPGLAAALFQSLAAKGVTVIAAEATGLIAEDGVVVGAATSSGAVRGRWTVLATGGFGANKALVARHLPGVERAVYIGVGPNDGRGHAWGEALGGQLAMMDSYQGQGHTIPDGLGRLGPGLTSFGAIVVNDAGRRFADESMGPSEFGAHVLAQPGGTAVELFDERIHAAAMQLSTYRASVARGVVVHGVDLPGLAAAFGLPEPTLRQTLETHAAVVAGSADEFGRVSALHPLVPPYYAARVTGALAHTEGGLVVDATARVRRGEGYVPGLLAAGAAAAGVSGHGAGYLPGIGLAHAFALGMVAGETVGGSRIG